MKHMNTWFFSLLLHDTKNNGQLPWCSLIDWLIIVLKEDIALQMGNVNFLFFITIYSYYSDLIYSVLYLY